MNNVYRKTRRFRVALIASLFLGFGPGSGDVVAQKTETSSALQTPWAKGGLFDGFTPEQEIKSRRGPNSKHFQNADGSVTVQIGRKLHYRDGLGNWQDIDPAIVPANGTFQNLSNSIKSYFPAAPGREGVRMVLENQTRFDWWQNPGLAFVNNGEVIKNLPAQRTTGHIQNGMLRYTDLYPGISEEFTIRENGMESSSIIHALDAEMAALPAGAELRFSQFIPLQAGWQVMADGRTQTADFNAERFSVRIGTSDNIYFGQVVVFDNAIDKNEALLVNMPAEALNAVQKAKLQQSVLTPDYRVRFVQGGIEVWTRVPAAWLQASDRAFPVTVDPSVTISPDNVDRLLATPLSHWRGYQRNADLYLQSEIGAYGSITRIEFNCVEEFGIRPGSVPVKVYLRSTAANTLTGNDAWNSATYTGAGATLSLDASLDQGSDPGWKTLDLTSPFPYTQDNLLVMVGDFWGRSGAMRRYAGSEDINYAGRQAANRANNIDPGDGAAMEPENILAEIRITYSSLIACTGVPTLGAATSSRTDACTDAAFELNVSSFTDRAGISYQWQSSVDGGITWNNLGSVQTETGYTASQAQTTHYRLIAACTAGLSDTSAAVRVGMAPATTCYCVQTIPFDCGNDDVIRNVTFAGINNNSGCDNATTGYSDYTGSVNPPSVNRGTSVPISVTVGEADYESVGVWIDYNQNGRLDSLEGEFTNLGTGLNTTLTANISIPATALPGTTRMRVVLATIVTMLNSYACGAPPALFAFGEMEDYVVTILLPVVDSVVVTTQGNVPAVIATPTGTLQLVAAVYPLTAPQGVTWSIRNGTGAAGINAAGLVTASSAGTVWGKAVSTGDPTKSDSILINIQPFAVDSVVVTTQGNVPAVIATPTGTLQLVAAVYPLTMPQGITWSIRNGTGAATINAAGLVTASSAGTVWGKAVSVANPTKSDSILITISPLVDSVAVATQGNVPAVISTPAGTLQLTATVYPVSSSQAVTWSIRNTTGAATISSTGRVTAQSNGSVWARARSVVNPLKADSILIVISQQNLGIDEAEVAFGLELFPNPTKDLVTLRSATPHGRLDLQVTDLAGRMLFTRTLQPDELNAGITVDVATLPPGVYVFRLRGSHVKIDYKVIRQ